jgi:acetylornithine deacetylase/succinyl-diaminopimelate desuccinylase-like protein
MDMEKIIRYLRDNQTRFIRELVEYVRFPSVSAQPQHRKDMTACATWLLRHCEKLGLRARLCPTAGHPIVIARTPRPRSSKRPHYVIYGHYDVQPAEPFDLWKSPPFQPRIEGRSLFGRGASDNKGQNFAHLKAVEAWLKTGSELPCDLTFVIEGEEEVGSNHLAAFLKSHRSELKCNAVVVSDTGMPSLKHPALTYSLRGIVAFELIVHGPSRDLHSGIFGGSVENPAMALSKMLARLIDHNGRINIPGFYDDVAPLSSYEKRHLARLPGTDHAYQKFLGVPRLFGERGFTSTERRTARPTLEINGLTSGYQGDGSKTIIPSWARAKLTLRLVPNQNPAKIARAFRKSLLKHCPPTVRLEIQSGHGAEPYLVSPASPRAQAALRALRAAFGHEPVLLREGGSIPIVNDFKKYLRADTLLLGLALPDDNAHSPNEKFDLDCFAKGQLMAAHLWRELACR